MSCRLLHHCPSVMQAFVRPWTQGTGASISLLYNRGKRLDAQVMISHMHGQKK